MTNRILFTAFSLGCSFFMVMEVELVLGQYVPSTNRAYPAGTYPAPHYVAPTPATPAMMPTMMPTVATPTMATPAVPTPTMATPPGVQPIMPPAMMPPMAVPPVMVPATTKPVLPPNGAAPAMRTNEAFAPLDPIQNTNPQTFTLTESASSTPLPSMASEPIPTNIVNDCLLTLAKIRLEKKQVVLCLAILNEMDRPARAKSLCTLAAFVAHDPSYAAEADILYAEAVIATYELNGSTPPMELITLTPLPTATTPTVPPPTPPMIPVAPPVTPASLPMVPVVPTTPIAPPTIPVAPPMIPIAPTTPTTPTMTLPSPQGGVPLDLALEGEGEEAATPALPSPPAVPPTVPAAPMAPPVIAPPPPVPATPPGAILAPPPAPAVRSVPQRRPITPPTPAQ